MASGKAPPEAVRGTGQIILGADNSQKIPSPPDELRDQAQSCMMSNYKAIAIVASRALGAGVIHSCKLTNSCLQELVYQKQDKATISKSPLCFGH
jgi:hypothetical protein